MRKQQYPVIAFAEVMTSAAPPGFVMVWVSALLVVERFCAGKVRKPEPPTWFTLVPSVTIISPVLSKEGLTPPYAAQFVTLDGLPLASNVTF